MPSPPSVPDHEGGSLLNLVAELELRLTGTAPSPRLHPLLGSAIPEAATYVILMLDGLGDHQLQHRAAGPLLAARRAAIDAPFPTTTTVSLATLVTGLAPRRHGLIGHLCWLPDVGEIVNTLKWIGKGGAPVDIDTSAFLPSPNLWERLAAAGVEPITVQPGHFADTPLTRALYRGARYEPAWDTGEVVDAILSLAAVPGRLILGYLPQVDYAAHVFGQRAEGYTQAMETVAGVWEAIACRLPEGVTMVGTADHGHLDYRASDKHLIDRSLAKGLRLFGDPRALYVSGPAGRIEDLAAAVPGTWHPLEEVREWWGAGPDHPDLPGRQPDGVLLAERGALLLPGHMDRRLIGYHGGLEPEEVRIPLLVAAP